MQAKVSMVMPCYNKVKYIGEMFDSIIAQRWDNIELILVNDGSTDGTREVIAAYEPQFIERGFEVVIVDQENAGVCAAAKAGLERITGEFVCMVDADDELDPGYVEVMAGWLAEHGEYAYCICDAVLYTGMGDEKCFRAFEPSDVKANDPLYLNRCLLVDIRSEVWVYMVRRDYLERCSIQNTYYTDTKGSHEPGFIIPLVMNAGKYKYFALPLYRFNIGSEGHSKVTTPQQLSLYHNEYRKLCQIAIQRLSDDVADRGTKKRLTEIAVFLRYMCAYRSGVFTDTESVRRILQELRELIESFYSGIMGKQYAGREDFILKAVQNKLLGYRLAQNTPHHSGRIVGYGALGKKASALLNCLQETPLAPTELWDMEGNGKTVKSPDFASLRRDDLILVLPQAQYILEQVKPLVDCHIMSHADICDYICNDLCQRDQPHIITQSKKKTKMLVVYSTFRIGGGAERFLLNFLELFPADTHQIDLLLFDGEQDNAKMYDMIPSKVNILPFLRQYSPWSPELEEELIKSGDEDMARVKAFVHNRNKDETFRKLPVGVRYEENWKELKKICPRYEGYDVAVAFMNTLPLKIVAENVAADKKFVFQHMDMKAQIEMIAALKSVYCYEQPYYEKMTGIVCVTAQNAASFREYFPALSDKVKVLKNVHNPALMHEQASAFYPPEYDKDVFTILTVARINPQKGIDMLLKSAYRLKDMGTDFRWIIAGNDPQNDYSERCHALAKGLGVDENVIFLGECHNPFPYYKNCDLYVQTSLFEGRPLTIEEAMTLNCPIVTTNFSSATDQITDGVNGRICAMDPECIADTILELYNDESERNRLASGNRGYSGDEDKKLYLEYFASINHVGDMGDI